MYGEASSESSFVFEFEQLQNTTGTALVKYNPVLDTAEKSMLLCITIMKEYENKSIEELRLEDRTVGRCKWSFKWPFGCLKPPFGWFNKPADTMPLFGGSNKPAETKQLFGWSNKPAETMSLFGGSNKPAETMSLFGGSNKPAETMSLFGGSNKPAETMPLFGGSNKPAETEPSFGGFDKTVEAKSPNGKSEGGLGSEGPSTVAFGGTGSNIPCFNLGDLPKDVRSTNKMQLCSKHPEFTSHSERSSNFQHSQSLVYKCACGLCFERPEVMFKHLIGCSPIKRIPRIHCVCGLEFDMHNFEYHREVHREFISLKKKDVAITDGENIDLKGMKEKFMRNKMKGIASDAEHKSKKIKVSADYDKYTAKETSIFKNRKSCVVYRCNCRLSFERQEFLLNHLNNCDPGEKITRIHCMCGLEFDEDNYDYHSEVHLIFTRLKVKNISVNGGKIIPISSMKQEFDKDVIKAAKSTKEAQVQTVHLHEPFIKNSAAELFFKGDGTFEQLLGQKIVSVVVDTIESGKDGKESQTKITIIIAKESEKIVECRKKTNTVDKNNEVTDIKTFESQKAADNTKKYITAPTEGDLATDNHAKSDISLNENIPKNKAVNSLFL